MKDFVKTLLRLLCIKSKDRSHCPAWGKRNVCSIYELFVFGEGFAMALAKNLLSFLAASRLFWYIYWSRLPEKKKCTYCFKSITERLMHDTVINKCQLHWLPLLGAIILSAYGCNYSKHGYNFSCIQLKGQKKGCLLAEDLLFQDFVFALARHIFMIISFVCWVGLHCLVTGKI